jgi:hypothetical protein
MKRPSDDDLYNAAASLGMAARDAYAAGWQDDKDGERRRWLENACIDEMRRAARWLGYLLVADNIEEMMQ